MTEPMRPRAQPQVQTIELTAKKWMLMQLLSVGVWFVSMIMLFSAAEVSSESAGAGGGLMGPSYALWALSILMLIGGRVGQWWHHG